MSLRVGGYFNVVFSGNRKIKHAGCTFFITTYRDDLQFVITGNDKCKQPGEGKDRIVPDDRPGFIILQFSMVGSLAATFAYILAGKPEWLVLFNTELKAAIDGLMGCTIVEIGNKRLPAGRITFAGNHRTDYSKKEPAGSTFMITA